MLHANCSPSNYCDIIKKDIYGNKDMKMIHLLFFFNGLMSLDRA